MSGHCKDCKYFPFYPQQEWCEVVPEGPEMIADEYGELQTKGSCQHWEKTNVINVLFGVPKSRKGHGVK